ERREARGDGLGDRFEDLQLEGAGEDHVERIVRERVALPARAALLDGGPNVATGADEGEVDVRGRSAEEHPPRVFFGAQREPRLVRMAHDRVGEVRVRVDAAGDHDLPGRIDDARGLERAGRTERRDALALNSEIPLPDAGRRHKTTTTDHEIEHDRLLTPRL